MSTDFLPRLTIGADPEIFLKRDGLPVSAHGLIKGTKWKPQRVKDGAVQIDGTALEFNINPANTVDEFCVSIHSVMASLRSMVPDEYEFDLSASRAYAQEYFDSVPEDAKELGCEPDWNAWTMDVNPRPEASTTLRTIAGHLHIGWLKEPADPEEHFYDCVEFVKQLDYCLGLPSLLIDNSPAAVERRKLYGKAGSFRPKPDYGVEYRVLSPFWLASEERVRWIFGMCQWAYERMQLGKGFHLTYRDTVKEVIDTNDVYWAKKFVQEQKWELPK